MTEESWVVSGPQVIEVDEVRSLRVQLVGGRVDVVTHEEPGARIEVHDVDGRPLEVSLIDGELRVGYQFTLGGWEGFLEKFRNFRDKDSADVSIAVPATCRRRSARSAPRASWRACTRGPRCPRSPARSSSTAPVARSPRTPSRARSSCATTTETSA